MFAILKRLQNYSNEYILKVKWIKIMLAPTLIALMFANYWDIQSIKIISTFIDGDNDSDNMVRDFVVLFLGYSALKYGVAIFDTYFIAYSVRRSYYNFFREYLSIKFSDFQKYGVGEVQYNIQRRSLALYNFFTAVTLTFLPNAFYFAIATRKVLKDLPFASAAKVILICTAFLAGIIYSQNIRSRIRRNANNGFENNSKKLYDILLNYERIKAYDNAEIESVKYYNSMEEQHRYAVIFWCTYDAFRYLNNVLFVLVSAFIFHEYNSVGGLTKVNGTQIVIMVSELSNKIKQISKDIDFICTHFTNLDQSLIESCEPEEQFGTLEIPPSLDQDIKIENLKFGFSKKLVFKNVFSTIRKSEKIAITGVNGGGKSTFVKILMGLYEYQGSIELDGFQLRNINRKSLRNLISYVPQNSQLFDTTLIENLKMGNPDLTDEKIVELCKVYNYHKLFKKLGYHSPIGERGRNISGGQRQKISFMRAVLKNAPIMILDEATSNLDKISEDEIINNIMVNMPGKTVVMIVHNLGTLRSFDRVFFFADQTLKMQGSFDKLYDAKNEFYRFYKSATTKIN